MGQLDRERWIAEENIARLELWLKRQSDPQQRTLFEALLAREREKLREKRVDWHDGKVP